MSQPGSLFTVCSSCCCWAPQTFSQQPPNQWLPCKSTVVVSCFGGVRITYFRRSVDMVFPPIQTVHHFTQVYCLRFMAAWNRLSIQLVLFQLWPRLDFVLFLYELGWASTADPPGSRGSPQGLCDSQVGVRKATRPCDSSTVSRRRAGGGEEERKQPLSTDGGSGQGGVQCV